MALRDAFKDKFFVLNSDNVNKSLTDPLGGNWTIPPECVDAIPGITRSITIVGKCRDFQALAGDCWLPLF